MTDRMVAAFLEQRTQVNQALADVQQRADQLSALLAGLSELGSRTSDSGVTTLRGVAAVRDWLAKELDDVQGESLSCVPGGGQPAASLAAALPLDRALLERGVRLQTLYQTSAVNDPVTRRHVAQMTALGEQVRTVPVVPMRMLISDRRVALVPIDPANTALGAIVVETPGIVAAFVSLFETYWAAGVPFGEDRAADDGVLTPHEQQVIRALADGLRDEEIAESLAVSVRTLRRTVASLMERLNASSRFSAGVAAVRQGWLPSNGDH